MKKNDMDVTDIHLWFLMIPYDSLWLLWISRIIHDIMLRTSVTGCSTCSRGFSSRKQKVWVSGPWGWQSMDPYWNITRFCMILWHLALASEQKLDIHQSSVCAWTISNLLCWKLVLAVQFHDLWTACRWYTSPSLPKNKPSRVFEQEHHDRWSISALDSMGCPSLRRPSVHPRGCRGTQRCQPLASVTLKLKTLPKKRRTRTQFSPLILFPKKLVGGFNPSEKY